MFALLVSTFFSLNSALAVDKTYTHSIESWRQQRESRLKKEDGWLSLVGLFWLKEGLNTAGISPEDSVRFPEGSTPVGSDKTIGRFELKSNLVSFEPSPGVPVELNGHPSKGRMNLRSDESGTPDSLKIGRVQVLIIKRSLGFGIRMKDPEAPTRKHFQGLSWYPVNEKFRIQAQFIAYPTPKKVMIPNILGGNDESVSPGEVSFRMNEKEQRLVAIEEGDELFFIFKDPTNGQETYSSGRFLNTDKPKNGIVDLDFNKAYTPPCGFTRFATCPLPPRQNFLKTAISAGEKYHGHHSLQTNPM